MTYKGRPLRICYLNITNHAALRTVYLKGLSEGGAEVIDIRETAKGMGKFLALYRRHRALGGRYDLLVVGYSAQILVPFARLFSRRPVIFNALSPLSEGMLSRQGTLLTIKALRYWCMDFLAFHTAFLTLLENNVLIESVSRKFFVNRRKLVRAWTGVNENDFFYDPSIPKLPHFTLVFRGELTNDSGIQYFIAAAKLLTHTDIRFRILSNRGPKTGELEDLLKTFDSRNVEWIRQHLEIADLRKKMQEAHLCVGWLSNDLRAFSSIPHKTYESLALKLPFIHARTPAMQELLRDNETVFFCDPSDAEGFAKKILSLKADSQLLERVAENGHRLFDTTLRSHQLAARLLEVLEERKFI